MVFATCLVNSGSHLAVSRFFGAFRHGVRPSRLLVDVNSMVLSFLENVISACCGPISDWETMAEKVLVTGGFGLVGSQTVRRLAADGHHVVATDLGTPAQRKAAASLPASAEAQLGRPDRPARGRPARRRGLADGDRAPGRGDSAAGLSPPPTRASRQRGRDRGAVARRGGKRTSAALRVGVQQRGLRVPQSASSPRPAARRLPAAAGGPLRRPQGGGRKPGPGFEFGVGDPAPRRGDQRRAGRDAVHRRRLVLRKRAADRRAHPHRRRPGRRGRVRRRNDGRCRRAKLC